MTDAPTTPLAGHATASVRRFADYYCPSCGMFLVSTDAPTGKRVRVKCTSKQCKGKLREVTVGKVDA